ncbi:MAG: nickel pincer cofactor biosynthesis protein LarC [Clostridia bacterium]|nr:nickel pincer cofactor biosynthesis protein LarC [Clostridia bacterium]
MKTLYFDCGMGAAGDMLCAALIELLPDPEAFIAELNGIGIPHVVFGREASEKQGIVGTHISVRVDGEEEHEHVHSDEHHEHHHEHSDEHHEHHHEHSDLASIGSIIAGLAVSDGVKADALAVYRSVAEAESYVHGRPVDRIHFHEVGALDAVADVTAFCLLMERLAPDDVVSSPIHVGSGTVRCAHGILPVPAPATAYLLKDIPIYGGEIKCELCTPTGAALLKHFVKRFGPMPEMRVSSIGYGMGVKDLPVANCVRAMLGETAGRGTQTGFELSAHGDDMTAEQIGFCMERLFEAGALEVYTVPVGMKKNRPGTLIRAIVGEAEKGSVLRAFFRNTTTLGIREVETKRYIMARTVEERDTELGRIRVKRSHGFGVERSKLEYEDVARIAMERDVAFSEAAALAEDVIKE